MVQQHFELVGPFTALENVLLGHEAGGWVLDVVNRRRPVIEVMQRYRLDVDLDARVQHLSIGVQQKVEILKWLYRGVQLLILDEPTTHLTPQEVDALFATLRDLVDDGLTVVLITHKLREITEIGDRVSVMRRGQVVATLKRAEVSVDRLVEGQRGGYMKMRPGSGMKLSDVHNVPSDAAKKAQDAFSAVASGTKELPEILDHIVGES